MKKLLFIVCCCIGMQAAAQDSAKTVMKQYLGVLTLTDKYKEEKNWGAAEQGIVGEHFQRLIKLKNEGVVVLAGRTELELNDANMMGLVIFKAKDDKEAETMMMNDPAVKAKIMQAKILPYAIAVSKCEQGE